MRYFSSVLVALDGSAQSREALKVACSVLRQPGGRLIGVYVAPPVPMLRGRHVQWVPEPPDAHRREAFALLREACERAFCDCGIAMETVLLDGDPVDEIVRLARTRGVDTIVIGSHGRKGMRRLLLGSVAEGVMRNSPVPVLVVHSASLAESQRQIGAGHETVS